MGARRESVRDKLRVHFSGSWGEEERGRGLGWPHIEVNYWFGGTKVWPLAALEGWPLVRGKYRDRAVRASIFWPDRRGGRW